MGLQDHVRDPERHLRRPRRAGGDDQRRHAAERARVLAQELPGRLHAGAHRDRRRPPRTTGGATAAARPGERLARWTGVAPPSICVPQDRRPLRSALTSPPGPGHADFFWPGWLRTATSPRDQLLLLKLLFLARAKLWPRRYAGAKGGDPPSPKEVRPSSRTDRLA